MAHPSHGSSLGMPMFSISHIGHRAGTKYILSNPTQYDNTAPITAQLITPRHEPSLTPMITASANQIGPTPPASTPPAAAFNPTVPGQPGVAECGTCTGARRECHHLNSGETGGGNGRYMYAQLRNCFTSCRKEVCRPGCRVEDEDLHHTIGVKHVRDRCRWGKQSCGLIACLSMSHLHPNLLEQSTSAGQVTYHEGPSPVPMSRRTEVSTSIFDPAT